ncbi:daunorubicin C-13 ketoreductase [Salinigranum rubrum]|uniref:Daunorubicin C-13 ketoreductase n=1 Tax=Salinigranum rubrum TaxID=755307 RepID=A0A2I8VG39_9EURY|nr:SDR family NAD(P)-dependent oxidoreductase [Salinigranum rubrum]AUV80880.1 daunorubicin C-13 ketoreductase [Salinigranum rubrum]
MTHPPEKRAGVEETDLTGTTALVTGSTSGIGRGAALALGRLGADVVVHGRDDAAGAELVDELTASGSDARFVRADFSDVGAVRGLADEVRAETDELDLLVNNAGGFFREARLTGLGVEYTFHVNHLSPYLLTAELLDHLAPEARVVTTASDAHRGVTLDLDSVASIEDYSGWTAYQRSKLANVQFAFELAKRLSDRDSKVTSNALHPGAIPGSGFTRFLPTPLSQGAKLLNAVPGVTSVTDGAAALVYLAISDRVDGVSGRYFSKQRPATPSQAARYPEAQRRLWQRSAELLGIDEPLTVD